MTDFALLASSAATTSQEPLKRRAYMIRAEHGYIAANHSHEGPPITLVADAAKATCFTQSSTAHSRAAALEDLGWSGLTVVSFECPILHN